MEQKLNEIIKQNPNCNVTFHLSSGKNYTYDPVNGSIDIRVTYLQYLDNDRTVIIAIDKIECIEIN